MNKIQFEDLPSVVSEILEKVNSIDSHLKRVGEASNKSDDGLLTISAAGELLNLSKNTIYKLAQHRAVPYIKKGGRLYFLKDELLAWVKEGKQKTAQELSLEAETALITMNKKRSKR